MDGPNPGRAGTDEPDFDIAVESAWNELRDRLADHIGRMEVGSTLILGTTPIPGVTDETHPYVQFTMAIRALVRCEVSSNNYLGVHYRLSEEDEAYLLEAGWHAPVEDPTVDSPNFHVDLSPVPGDRPASMAVDALRDVLGVAHPSFLEPRAWNEHGPVRFSVGSGESDAARPDRTVAISPTGSAHLMGMVEDAINDEGHDFEPLENQLQVDVNDTLVFVRVVHHAPIVEISTPLVHAVRDRTRAAERLNDLNLEHEMVKFLLYRDYVVVTAQLPSMPFVAEHFTDMLDVIASASTELSTPLAADLGGRPPFAVS